MKTQLIIYILCIVFSVECFAQDLVSKAQPLTFDEVVYLYNLDGDGFLCGGNDWGTQASLNRHHGWKVIIRKALDADGKWDGETVYLTDSIEYGDFQGSYRKVFVDRNGLVYTDQAQISKYFTDMWTFHTVGKNIYRIDISSENSVWNLEEHPNAYLGVTDFSAETPTVDAMNEKKVTVGNRWIFLSPEDYDKIHDAQRHTDSVVNAVKPTNKTVTTKSKRHKVIAKSSAKRKVTLLSKDEVSLPFNKVVYLYNKDYQGFLIGGNDWETQASLDYNRGWKVILRKALDADGSWDGKTVYITDSVETGGYNGQYRNLFFEQDGTIYTDQSIKSQCRDNKWGFRKVGTGIYVIEPSDKNIIWNHKNIPDSYVGIKNSHVIRPILELINKEKDYEGGRWAILTEEDYAKLQYSLDVEKKQAILQVLVDAAKRKNLPMETPVDISKFNDKTELLLEIGRMRELLLENQQGTKDTADWTRYIKNPQFEIAAWGNIDWHYDWDINAGSITWRGGLNTNYCAEIYQAKINLYQTIEGLAPGLYRLDVQAYNRPHSCGLSWFTRDEDIIVPEIYANDMSMPVKNLFDELPPDSTGKMYNVAEKDISIPGEYAGTFALLPDGVLYPDNMQAESTVFSAGMYNNSVYCRVDSGVLTIGIRQDRKDIANWTAWDNFRLTYLGNNSESYCKALTALANASQKTVRCAERDSIDATKLRVLIDQATLSDVSPSATTVAISDLLSSLNAENKAVRQKIMDKEFTSDALGKYYTTSSRTISPLDSLLEIEKSMVSIASQQAGDCIKKCIQEADAMPEYAMSNSRYQTWYKKTTTYCNLYSDALTISDQAMQDTLTQRIMTQCREAFSLDSIYYDDSTIMALYELNRLGNVALYAQEYDKALKLYVLCSQAYDALPVGMDTLKNLHYKTSPLYNQALTHDKMGHIDQSFDIYQQALEMHKKLIEGDSEKYVDDMIWMLNRLCSFTNSHQMQEKHEEYSRQLDAIQKKYKKD